MLTSSGGRSMLGGGSKICQNLADVIYVNAPFLSRNYDPFLTKMVPFLSTIFDPLMRWFHFC